MFDRRVKIFLWILVLFTGVLLLRAMQLQVFQSSRWRDEAVKVMTRPELIDTTRGRLLDRRGRAIAEDVPCIDACVDFRAVLREPDMSWLRTRASQRLRERMGGEYRARSAQEREKLIEQEMIQVRTDIAEMWRTLARLGNKTPEQIEDIRNNIVRKVELRQRYAWYFKYQRALKDLQGRAPSPWYQRWLIDETQDAPQVDQFKFDVAEQTAAHPILRAVDSETSNFLWKNRDRFPGLELLPSVHREYPYRQAGAHLIGHLANVKREDLEADVNKNNPLRKYWPNDQSGRSGLEALCEPLLRGTRGRIERYLGDQPRELARVEPVSGMDVQTTIDIALQKDVHEAFRGVILKHRDPAWEDSMEWMPGAAVVLDVATNEVLAMASYPSFDLNTFDDDYASLRDNVVDRPLMNRATQFALEPGSTVKPIVGLGAITAGIIAVDGTIECTGYMIVNGKQSANGRCWVATSFASQLPSVAHHPIPYEAPHPTGMLNFADAIERSCNIFFETAAERMGMETLANWMDRFGLGRPTGVGLAEASGRLPDADSIPSYLQRRATWFSGMGQSQVLATPIQMANVSATIARGGVWMRPRLVPEGTEVVLPKVSGPERVDLHLAPAALAAVKDGMTRVVNSRAGTGNLDRHDAFLVAGKTGSAQASFLSIPKPHDAPNDADIVVVQIQGERREFLRLKPGTHANPNPKAFWYRYTGETEDRRSHAWYMGFAPADNPKIAFAVMIEYGGGGGATAGQVASRLLDACIKHGYLPANR